MIRAALLAATLTGCTMPILADGYRDTTRTGRQKSDLDYWISKCKPGTKYNILGTPDARFDGCMRSHGWAYVETIRVN